MTDWEPYVIQTVPIVVLGAIYGLLGFELAVVMGLGMIAGTLGTRP